WLEKSAEKQKHKLRKTLNPLSRKAFKAASFSATKDNRSVQIWALRFFIGVKGTTGSAGGGTLQKSFSFKHRAK
ncbi:hypothetical protein, partial [uncultured Pseudoflavonifractor sp.]|uniref:hypothetical protein n=1 Tax=uncultured Pseudoflavonifractor sp. TaxID=1221379 RepID=UPI0025F0660B